MVPLCFLSTPSVLPQHFLRPTAIFGLYSWPASFLVFHGTLVSWLTIISVLSSLTWGFDPIISISFIGTLLCISRPSNYYSGLRHGLKTTTWPSWLLRYHQALLLRPALYVIPRYEIVLLCVLMLSVGLRPHIFATLSSAWFLYALECCAWVYPPTYFATFWCFSIDHTFDCI